MAAIGYLLRKTIKNWLLDLKNKPQFIILLAFVVLMLLMASKGGTAPGRYNEAMVSSLFFVVGLLFGGMTLYGGLSETRTFFRMADVNLLFPAPIKPAHVIVYGMIHNIGTLAFSLIFLLYQIGTLRMTLGMTTEKIVLAFLCLFLLLILCLATSVCLMLFCSGRPDRTTFIKRLCITVLGLLVIYAVVAGHRTAGAGVAALFTSICANPYLDVLPIFGWARGLFVGLCVHNALLAAACGLPLIALLITEIFFIAHTKSDYYEDVLDGASRREMTLQAVKNGKRASFKASSKEKIIRGMELNAGEGASVFYYKRMLERKRGALGMVGISCVLIAVAGLFLSVVLHVPFIAYLGIAVMLSIIFRRINSWEAELDKVYIYLAPAPPEKKLLYILLPEMSTALTDGAAVLVMGIALFRAGLAASFTGAAAYISVCAVITASSVIVRRLFGNDSKNALVQIVQAYLPMILLGLGLAPIVILQFAFSGTFSPVITYAATTVWDIAVSALLLFCGRGVLERCGDNSHAA